MKGSFNGLKDIEKFSSPLKVIGLLMGDNGVNLSFFKDEDDNRVAMVPARNKTTGVVIIHKWKNLFNDFDFDSDDERVGILKVNEFISRLGIFTDEKKEIEIEKTDDGILTLTQGQSILQFKTSDPELISEGKRKFKGADWIGVLDYDERLTSFTNALKVMASEQYIFAKGIKDKGEIVLSVQNKDVQHNAFKIPVDAEVTEDFELVFKKENIQIILSSKPSNIKIRFSDRMMNIHAENDDEESDYFISKVVSQ